MITYWGLQSLTTYWGLQSLTTYWGLQSLIILCPLTSIKDSKLGYLFALPSNALQTIVSAYIAMINTSQKYRFRAQRRLSNDNDLVRQFQCLVDLKKITLSQKAFYLSLSIMAFKISFPNVHIKLFFCRESVPSSLWLISPLSHAHW